jgi:uncharacterized protein with predicted RNA binding PUA domain
MGDSEDVAALRVAADYQFGRGVGETLFPPGADLTIEYTTGGRPRQVHAAAGRLVTYAVDGRFTLGIEGGRRLLAARGAPANRVTVGEESDPFVRDGKNAFAKFVRRVDPAVRPGDEVVVVTEEDTLLGVGRAELWAAAMNDFDSGMAVKVRAGAGSDD